MDVHAKTEVERTHTVTLKLSDEELVRLRAFAVHGIRSWEEQLTVKTLAIAEKFRDALEQIEQDSLVR